MSELDATVTYEAFGSLVGCSKQAIGEAIKRGVLRREAPLREWLAAYCQNLRDAASGHKSSDGDDLVRERVLTERVDRELKQLQVAEKRGLLINVAQLEPALMQMVSAFRTELLSRDDKLKDELDALYSIDVDIDILNGYTCDALSQFARYDASGAGAARPSDGDAEAVGEDIDDSMGA